VHVDPELRAALAEFMADGPQALTPATIPAARAANPGRLITDDDLRHGGTITVERRTAGDVPVLILRPAGRSRPLPAMVYLHGGGLVMGDERNGLPGVLDWVAQLGLVLVSVRYRLAPEHPYPAAVEDGYGVLQWAAESGIGEPLLIGGGSAGAGLAAAVALLARDRGGVQPAGQLLMCPMLDDRTGGTELRPWEAWDRVSNRTGWTALLGDARGGPDVPAYAAPARATDLSGLPPAFIDVGSADLFLAEDVDYARRIWAAGGSAELHVWAGAFHGFDGAVPTAAVSVAARAARLDWLRRLLAS
jgi:acetyl esterase/lipase